MVSEGMAPGPLPVGSAREIQDHRWFFWISGTLSIVAGVFAILMPYIATFAAALAIGAVITVNGMIGCVTAFKARKTSRIAMGFILGLLGLAVGILLLVYPLSGVIALTLVLTAFLLAGGLLKLYFAWRMRPLSGWGWMAAGGALSIGLGALIWSGLPGTAFWVLGLLVGIDLIFYGTTLLATIIAARNIVNEDRGRHEFGTGQDHPQPRA